MAEGEDMLDAALRHGAVPRTVFAVPDPPPSRSTPAGASARPDGARDRVGGRAGRGGIARQRLARDRRLGAARHRGRTGSAGARTAFSTSTRSPIPETSGRCCGRRRRSERGCVVLSPRTADPFGPKAVRASMGAVFGQPVARARLRAGARRGRPAAIALVPGAGRPLRDWRSTAPSLFVLGAERAGLPEDVVAACDEIAHVPLATGGADSLNVAMAATLCLYEYRASHA